LTIGNTKIYKNCSALAFWKYYRSIEIDLFQRNTLLPKINIPSEVAN